MISVQELRDSYDAFKAYSRACKATAKLEPVYTWGEYKYILVYPLKLTPGPQRVTVIDITDRPDVALFAGMWPDQGERNKALVLYPDEGHTAILCEDGIEAWVYYSEIVVRMFPGTYDDFRNLRNQMDDELQDAVDSGARIEW